MLLRCALAIGISGCTHSGADYPALRDMPALPEGTTPEAERQRIIDELKQEMEPSPGPAVPAVPRAAADPGLRACAEEAELAQAVPALRGTLHGDWRAPAVAPSPGSAAGVTAAIRTLPASIIVGFAPGTSELMPADVTRLREAAARFLYQGGESVLVQARGRPAQSASPQPLAGVSLGLKRASAIATALIDGGIAANRIKIAAAGDEDVPGVPAASLREAGPDSAVVVFEAPKR